ncbi:thiol-disulfide oxidoreductase DCC family protein [Streptomyces yunnanensis]|uniref:DUF393 domain-containing protein n=1 Tax=Streptomyces yunnanensis TaxID=156453 RepID=A0A9X8N5L8_9ACTN|nr:DCC1-like thiol-disulfide oxidoreductase family protein [Streptomyces yunnanensis]SHN08228.1 Protein of unknown function, DUF393 [Streptomyces yunnanensis]
MTVTVAAADRGAPSAPVRRLTVLYDAHCPLCAFLRDWLARQRQLVPLDLVPAGTQEARQRLPELDHTATLEEITVVGDGGQVYRGAAAWVVCLWALHKYRRLAHKLAPTSGLRFARGAVLAAAKYRETHRVSQPTEQPAYTSWDSWASPVAPFAPPGCRSGCAVHD